MGPVVLSGVHTLMVQVASLISPTQQLQLNVPWRVGAGGQCWCDERVLPVHGPPTADWSSTQPSAAQSHTERPHQQVPAGGCCYLSIGRPSQTLALLKPLSFYWTQPHPCTVPLSQPNMFKNILFFSNSSFLEPAQLAGGGELVPGQQLLWRWPLAVLQFLLLKHWFQMVLDTKMEKSKPPCETSFQKKRISLKKGGRCDQKTQPLPEQKMSYCSNTCDRT